MKRYLLELVVFLTGGIVMVLELVGARLVAPHLGSSIIVWTALISIILAGLSLGAWWGGRLADKYPHQEALANILSWSALSIALIVHFGDWLLSNASVIPDLRIASLIAALLFVTPSFLLGAVSPFAVRLRLKEVSSCGSTVGALAALSTVGSILGTILGGFFFVAHIGTKLTLALLALLCVLTAVALSPRFLFRLKTASIAAAVALALLLPDLSTGKMTRYYETPYSRVWITEEVDRNTARPVRSLKFDPFSTQSSIYIDENSASDPFYKLQVNFGRLERELAIPYTRFFELATHFKPEINHILILGGAGFAYPRYCLSRFPTAKVDVVEIDSGMTDLAKEFFNLSDNPRLNIIHADARAYLNITNKTYDLVVMDVFNSGFSLPFQLSTAEAFQRISRILADDGLVEVNLISAVSGPGSELYQNEMATLQAVFPHVFSFPVADALNQRKVQNQILVGLKQTNMPSLESADQELSNYLARVWPNTVVKNSNILTDDFAPVEYFGAETVLAR